MDNTTFAYLFGAFILGFLIAWIAGRSGPNRALKGCEANSQDLQRKLTERDSAVTKAEAKLIERQAELDRVSADKAKVAAALQAAEVQFAAAGEETADLQLRLRDNEGEVLRLRTELRHISDAWADASARSADLGGQLEQADRSAAVMAVEAAEAIVEAEEAIAVAAADELSASAQIDELAAKLDVMTRELDLTRAAAARTAAMAMLRPQLTPERREEYAALADDPEQVVQALHKRDIAVADAVNETSYLRRSLGILTAMGSELAGALEKRNRDYDAVAQRLSRVTLLAEATPPAVTPPAEPKNLAPRPDVITAADAAKAAVAATIVKENAANTDAANTDEVDAAFTELQGKIDELQAQLAAAGAAQGDLESRLQAQGLSYEHLVTRLAEISAELEALQADEDAAPTITPEPEAEVAAAPDAASAVSTPADDVLKRLTAGVAIAMTTIQRKNAHLTDLVAERSVLESGLAEKEQVLADQSVRLQATQDDLGDRSVKYDALSLHASSLEMEVEQALQARAELDDQLRTLAEELTALADQYLPAAAPEAASAETPVADDAALAPDAAADATQAPVTDATDATTPVAVDEAAAPAATLVEAEAVAAPAPADAAQQEGDNLTGAALLAAAVARIRAAVAKQETDLADASARLSTLADQLDTVDNEEAALSATISDQEAALADAGQQLEALRGNWAVVVAERDGFQQRVDGYRAQLSELLAQYAEAEPVEQPAAEAAPIADAPIADAPAAALDAAATTAADGAETATVADATPAAVEPVAPAVDDVAVAIAAIGALFARKQASLGTASARVADLESQLGDLANTKGALDATLVEKDQALAGAVESYSGLQGEFSKRSVQFDALSLHASSLEADLEIARMEQAKFESQIQAVADKLGALAASYAEAPTAEPVAADTAPIDAPAAVDAAPAAEPVVLPLATQLETSAAAVIAVVEAKSAALAAAQTEIAALQQDLDSRSGDLDAAATQTADLEAQLAAAEAARAELDNSLAEIGQQVEALRVEFDDAPAPDAAAGEAAPADGAPAEADAERKGEVGPAPALAGIAGLGIVLARRRQVLEESKAHAAELAQQVADLTAQLEAAELDRDQIKQNLDVSGQQIESLNLQIADLQAQLDAAVAERDQLQASVEGIGHTLEELGAAADEDDDEKLDSAAEGLVKAGLVAGGATVLVGTIRNKRASLNDANAQIEQLQQQLADTAAAEAEIATRASAQALDFEATSNQVSELQAKLDALAAEKASLDENMQRQAEDALAQLQARDAEAAALRRQLEIETDWQRKTPFLANLGYKLSQWTGFKSVAANAALEEQVIPKSAEVPENLAYTKHIGKTYEQRLYGSQVGTFWELAHVPDEDLVSILKLNELQVQGMNFEEVRASARQLAVENGTVGYLWDGQQPDDFEPIKGIGKTFETRLYDAGIKTYRQLVALSAEQLAEICQPKPPLKPDFADWIVQAQAFLAAREEAKASAAASEAAESAG